MSRIGLKSIKIPKGVEVKVNNLVVEVKGPKGVLKQEIKEGVEVEIKDDFINVSVTKKGMASFHGLYRALINNMVVGTSAGFEKRLELIGVGYRASVEGKEIVLLLGFSFPIRMKIPEGIQVNVEKSINVVVSGIDKQKIGEFAAEIRASRPPEPYKGKGIRYKGEYVRRKAGKAGKK